MVSDREREEGLATEESEKEYNVDRVRNMRNELNN